MSRRFGFLSVYTGMFILCRLVCGRYMEVSDIGEYEKTIDMFTYQLAYPDTYSAVFPANINETRRNTGNTAGNDSTEKTAYLTFDDGPTPRTGEILDILQRHDIKATFFVIVGREEYTPYMQRAVNEGHTVGVHSASHDYKKIYSSVDAYLQDFTQCYDYIFNETGYQPVIYRFPGGSVNNYNARTRREIAEEMSRRGFVYFDWNVESGDSGKLSAEEIYRNVTEGCKGKQRAVIIMHDSAGKKTTVRALENIIDFLKKDGWVFKALDNEVKPMIFRMK